jgi:F0F1-type ATP synthase assembly protein I
MAQQDAPGSPGTRSVGAYATAGIEFAVAILLFLFAGQVLDRRLGTSPWFVMIGAFVGAAAGWYALYRTLTRHRKRIETEHRSG